MKIDLDGIGCVMLTMVAFPLGMIVHCRTSPLYLFIEGQGWPYAHARVQGALACANARTRRECEYAFMFGQLEPHSRTQVLDWTACALQRRSGRRFLPAECPGCNATIQKGHAAQHERLRDRLVHCRFFMACFVALSDLLFP